MSNRMALGAYPATSSSYTPGSVTHLLPAGAQFTCNIRASGAQDVAELTSSGADGITLNVGELDAFQIDPTTSTVSCRVRDGVQTVTGQAYRKNQFSSGNMDASNGAIRDFGFAIAVTSVPEPAIVDLMGMGIVPGGVLIRRRVA